MVTASAKQLLEDRDSMLRAARIEVGREPLVYERNGPHSFIRDQLHIKIRRDQSALDRHKRHREQLRVVAEERLRYGQTELRDLTRTDTTSTGEMVPPLWLLDDFAGTARSFRITADLIGSRPLPPKTDVIKIPRLTTGTAVTVQTADNAAVQKTDAVSATVSIPVVTIAGQQDAALQLIEQGPNMDEHLLADMVEDYAAQLEAQILAGSGASGQMLGIINTASINAVTYTDATPTVAELWPKFADAANRIDVNRKRSPQAVVVHGRRWFWTLAALDTQTRPFAVPNPGYAPFSSVVADLQAGNPSVAGQLLGVPTFLSDAVPTTLGGGTEDVIIIFRPSDCRLWEGPPLFRVMLQTISNTLEARCQLRTYAAFTAGRYPTAVSTVGGSGLAAPTF